jgi:hypothetical protein
MVATIVPMFCVQRFPNCRVENFQAKLTWATEIAFGTDPIAKASNNPMPAVLFSKAVAGGHDRGRPQLAGCAILRSLCEQLAGDGAISTISLDEDDGDAEASAGRCLPKAEVAGVLNEIARQLGNETLEEKDFCWRGLEEARKWQRSELEVMSTFADAFGLRGSSMSAATLVLWAMKLFSPKLVTTAIREVAAARGF